MTQLLESSELPKKGATRTSPRQAERTQARTTQPTSMHHPAPLGTHASMLRCLSEQHIPTHQAGAVGGAGSTSTARKGCEVIL